MGCRHGKESQASWNVNADLPRVGETVILDPWGRLIRGKADAEGCGQVLCVPRGSQVAGNRAKGIAVDDRGHPLLDQSGKSVMFKDDKAQVIVVPPSTVLCNKHGKPVFVPPGSVPLEYGRQKYIKHRETGRPVLGKNGRPIVVPEDSLLLASSKCGDDNTELRSSVVHTLYCLTEPGQWSRMNRDGNRLDQFNPGALYGCNKGLTNDGKLTSGREDAAMQGLAATSTEVHSCSPALASLFIDDVQEHGVPYLEQRQPPPSVAPRPIGKAPDVTGAEPRADAIVLARADQERTRLILTPDHELAPFASDGTYVRVPAGSRLLRQDRRGAIRDADGRKVTDLNGKTLKVKKASTSADDVLVVVLPGNVVLEDRQGCALLLPSGSVFVKDDQQGRVMYEDGAAVLTRSGRHVTVICEKLTTVRGADGGLLLDAGGRPITVPVKSVLADPEEKEHIICSDGSALVGSDGQLITLHCGSLLLQVECDGTVKLLHDGSHVRAANGRPVRAKHTQLLVVGPDDRAYTDPHGHLLTVPYGSAIVTPSQPYLILKQGQPMADSCGRALSFGTRVDLVTINDVKKMQSLDRCRQQAYTEEQWPKNVLAVVDDVTKEIILDKYGQPTILDPECHLAYLGLNGIRLLNTRSGTRAKNTMSLIVDDYLGETAMECGSGIALSEDVAPSPSNEIMDEPLPMQDNAWPLPTVPEIGGRSLLPMVECTNDEGKPLVTTAHTHLEEGCKPPSPQAVHDASATPAAQAYEAPHGDSWPSAVPASLVTESIRPKIGTTQVWGSGAIGMGDAWDDHDRRGRHNHKNKVEVASKRRPAKKWEALHGHSAQSMSSILVVTVDLYSEENNVHAHTAERMENGSNYHDCHGHQDEVEETASVSPVPYRQPSNDSLLESLVKRTYMQRRHRRDHRLILPHFTITLIQIGSHKRNTSSINSPMMLEMSHDAAAIYGRSGLGLSEMGGKARRPPSIFGAGPPVVRQTPRLLRLPPSPSAALLHPSVQQFAQLLIRQQFLQYDPSSMYQPIHQYPPYQAKPEPPTALPRVIRRPSDEDYQPALVPVAPAAGPPTALPGVIRRPSDEGCQPVLVPGAPAARPPTALPGVIRRPSDEGYQPALVPVAPAAGPPTALPGVICRPPDEGYQPALVPVASAAGPPTAPTAEATVSERILAVHSNRCERTIYRELPKKTKRRRRRSNRASPSALSAGTTARSRCCNGSRASASVSAPR